MFFRTYCSDTVGVAQAELNYQNTFTNVAGAARICGVSKNTIRVWSRGGKLPFFTINARGDRRFLVHDLYTVMGLESSVDSQPVAPRVAVYVRVSGRTGQNSSLKAQEEELRRTVGEGMKDSAVVGVFKDKASGLNQDRPGLARLLAGAKNKDFDVVYVTHADRLARFGVGFLEQLLNSYGVKLVVLHEPGKVGSQEELVEDFISLVGCFSGRIYGQRSAECRRRLLAQVAQDATDVCTHSPTAHQGGCVCAG